MNPTQSNLTDAKVVQSVIDSRKYNRANQTKIIKTLHYLSFVTKCLYRNIFSGTLRDFRARLKRLKTEMADGQNVVWVLGMNGVPYKVDVRCWPNVES
jgi:hypothetical protein